MAKRITDSIPEPDEWLAEAIFHFHFELEKHSSWNFRTERIRHSIIQELYAPISPGLKYASDTLQNM